MSEITFAQVADKALDKLSNGMGGLVSDAEKFATALISRIDQIAPQVAGEIRKVSLYAWECMIRQKRAEGIFYIIGAIIVPCIFYLWYKYLVKKLWESNNYDIRGWGWVSFIVLGLLTSVLSPLFLYWGITYLVSPEYYAVYDLVDKLYSASHPSTN